MTTARNWTRNELILAANLYCKTPFGRIHTGNPDIIKLAKLIGRTPGAVSYKLANFASIDPSLDRKGAANTSKQDIQVWNEFFGDWDKLAYESELLLSQLEGRDIAAEVRMERPEEFPSGSESQRLVRVRINQAFFRQMVLSGYGCRCCITDITLPQLLVASHIVPWSHDAGKRLNPRNGLCLNALHDRAFDRGLLTLSDDMKVIISKKVKSDSSTAASEMLLNFEGKPIALPTRFLPDPDMVAYHRANIFQQ